MQKLGTRKILHMCCTHHLLSQVDRLDCFWAVMVYGQWSRIEVWVSLCLEEMPLALVDDCPNVERKTMPRTSIREEIKRSTAREKMLRFLWLPRILTENQKVWRLKSCRRRLKWLMRNNLGMWTANISTGYDSQATKFRSNVRKLRSVKKESSEIVQTHRRNRMLNSATLKSTFPKNLWRCTSPRRPFDHLLSILLALCDFALFSWVKWRRRHEDLLKNREI